MSDSPYLLPSGWEYRRLIELASIVSGGTPSRANEAFWGGDIPWVTPSDVTARSGIRLQTTFERITKKGLRASSAKLLPAGTVLMTSRATLGESKLSEFPVCTNQGFKSLVPKAGVDGLYLLYQMRFHKHQYANFGIGTTFLEVNKRDTERFRIPIPARFEDQRHIAELLSTLDEQIEQTEALVAKMFLMRAGLVQSCLLPEAAAAPTVSLGEACPGVTSGSRGWARYYAPEGALFLRIGNLTREHPNLRFDDVIRVQPPAGGEGARTRLEVGDLLISITADLGIIGCAPEGLGEAYVNQHIALARVVDQDLNPRWAAHVLASPFGSSQIDRLNDGGAKAGLNLPTIRALRIPRPLPERQNAIVALLDAADAEIGAGRAMVSKLKAQKDGLMPDLLTGRIRAKIAEETAV